jgi:uncharacterized protein with ParB-like and HNH nuclease domain
MQENISEEELDIEIEGDGQEEEIESTSIKEYDIVSSPNDFNVGTIYDFIESGVVKIPGFQRNYVWDIKRASKLIESIIIGLPIPQVFLYEEDRNSFLVIDGQQRLMTVYYFKKKRFPKKEKRSELRKIFAENGSIPDHILHSSDYFTDFKLSLPAIAEGEENKFNKLNYATLGEYQATFNLRTIRNIIIKQTLPKENDDSSKYEIFNRLNSGGVNLTPQEIRTSIYHSEFYSMLYRVNLHPWWRTIMGKDEADLHMKDIEILLRGFAMLINGESYKSPMTRFLNNFSKDAKKYTIEKNRYYEELFMAFLESSSQLDPRSFTSRSGKFNISIFESIFTAMCSEAYQKGSVHIKSTDGTRIQKLKDDKMFINATQEGVAGTSKVALRLKLAKETL